eukprot:scaffold3350_cov268-Pinguiococcus_pyrenoidosus.AAC.7
MLKDREQRLSLLAVFYLVKLAFGHGVQHPAPAHLLFGTRVFLQLLRRSRGAADTGSHVVIGLQIVFDVSFSVPLGGKEKDARVVAGAQAPLEGVEDRAHALFLFLAAAFCEHRPEQLVLQGCRLKAQDVLPDRWQLFAQDLHTSSMHNPGEPLPESMTLPLHASELSLGGVLCLAIPDRIHEPLYEVLPMAKRTSLDAFYHREVLQKVVLQGCAR